jgi:hypothetical protein
VHCSRRPTTLDYERNAETAALADLATIRDVEIYGIGWNYLAGVVHRGKGDRDEVILLHGVSDNRFGMYGYGRWLVKNHYAVLLADARGHGVNGDVAM